MTDPIDEAPPVVQNWFNAGNVLKTEMLEYNWKYRKKICTKCPLETQKRLKCLRVDEYRTIKGERIQETHYNKLVKARTAKFRNRINAFLSFSPFGMRSHDS